MVSDRLAGTRRRAGLIVARLAGSATLSTLLVALDVDRRQPATPHDLGLAFGLTNALAQLGAMSAPLIGGWLRDRTASFAAACYISAAVLGVAAVVVPVGFRGEEPSRGPATA